MHMVQGSNSNELLESYKTETDAFIGFSREMVHKYAVEKSSLGARILEIEFLIQHREQ